MGVSIVADDAGTVAVGNLRVLALESDAAPAGLGGTYARIHAGASNDAGDVAVSLTLAGASTCGAIVLMCGGTTRTLLRCGDPAPNGGSYRAFRQLDLGDNGLLLFQAELDDSSASEGVFLWTPAGVRAIALAGSRSSRGNTYRSFAQLTLTSCQYDAGPFLELAFVATMQQGCKSIVVERAQRPATEILCTADQLGDEIVEDVTISRLGISLSCIATLRRANERFQRVLLVHDGIIVHGDALGTGRDFGELGKVAHILGPPAINAQEAFVAVVFADGRSGLATREVGSASQVFAQTGDPAPGVADQRIRSFGAVVSNSGLTREGPCGVASVVQLSDGRRALWVGVFAQQIPLAGAAILPLLEGESTDDERSLIVHSFAPLKLTDAGALLLRVSVADGEVRREGLLMLDGLFDWSASTPCSI